MTVENLDVKAIGTTRIEPGSSKLIHALRHLGYSFEQAVADLIDNSLSAHAQNICLRFVTSENRLESFLIVDDGLGMTEQKLEEAMRFGSKDDYHDRSLGKYGLGLKLASLSHATAFDVLTMHQGRTAARRWTVSGLSKDWHCDVLDQSDAKRVMSVHAPEASSGTVVIWRDIDRLNFGKQGVRKGVQQLCDRLHLHVGLYFHRFLERAGVRMVTEVVSSGSDKEVIHEPIDAINPFKYPESGHPEYPQTFDVDVQNCGTLQMRACIWPANAKSAEYKLGGKAAQRQGFYFYRRDRLIQAGGWNGVVDHEAEPHTSLARIAVDLPAELDSHFGLSVQKSKVVTPPAFVASVTGSRDSRGDSWLTRYRKAANQAYRHDDRATDDYPLLPGDGIPRELIDLAREQLADGRQRRIKNVRFQWATLSSPDFFEIDRERLTVRLNRSYRSAILAGRRGTQSDAPILKLLLFFVLQDDLNRDRMRAGRKERIDAINRLLSEAVEHEDRR